MEYVFDTVEDIIKFLQKLFQMTDNSQRELDFKNYFSEYEKAVRSANDLSNIPENRIKSTLANNLVYLSGYCGNKVQDCIEELTCKILAEACTQK